LGDQIGVGWMDGHATRMEEKECLWDFSQKTWREWKIV